MTIAVCYVCPEGVVLGADSTSSAGVGAAFHYFNHNQKLFELGEGGTIALVTYGMGAIGALSYRTLWARLADDLRGKSLSSVDDVAAEWVQAVSKPYRAFVDNPTDVFATLRAKAAYDPQNPGGPASTMRSEEEERQYKSMCIGLRVGFFIGGYYGADRNPRAVNILFDPLAATPPSLIGIDFGLHWAGAPNMVSRLIQGYDVNLREAIKTSPHWKGKDQDLDAILAKQSIGPSSWLPIRDAIDYVHFCISSTIKGLKFSSHPQICGGPIEIGVITTDRRFRWVLHKAWDAAIEEGAT